MDEARQARFPLGECVATQGADAAMRKAGLDPGFLLLRHRSGDWGVVSDADKAENEESLREGRRLMSAYPLNPCLPCAGWGDNTLWIITEWDRSRTTILLPEEY